MSRHARRITAVTAAAAVLTSGVLLVANGWLGGQDAPVRQEGGPGPEQPVLRVETLEVMDAAPLLLAIDKGYFAEAGFREIKLSVGKGGGANVAKLTGGATDIAFASYTPFFVAQAKDAAKNAGGLRLVADGSSAPAKTQMIVAGPNSPVKRIQDLPGKRFGVTNRNTMSQFLPMTAMLESSVPYDTVQWIETDGFPAMEGMLLKGEIDAAYLTQPFLEKALRAGVQPIFDTAPAIGSSASGIALTGYGATADFVARSPKTIAAFQKAMARAVDDARQDRRLVEAAILKQMPELSTDILKNIGNLPKYESTLAPTRIQSVIDMMLAFKALPKQMWATDMIAKQVSQ